MKRVLSFASALAVLLVSGCATGPAFQRPQVPQAERYTENALAVESAAGAGESAQRVELGRKIDNDWWRMFQSSALDATVKRALEKNRALIAAGATLAQAQELAAAQAGTADPQVGLTAGVGRQKYGAEFLGTLAKPPPFTYFAIGPTVSYTLDYTGGVAKSIEQKYALAEYQKQQMNAAYLTVAGNAVMLSVNIASLRAQIATVEEILGQDRENLKLTHGAFDAGSVSRVDILTAESQLASDTTLLPPLRQELSRTRHALALVLGELPANAALPDFDLADIVLPASVPLNLPSELAHRRPDILAAEAQLHAATAAVGVATANLYPHINLSATLGQQAVASGQLFNHASTAWGLISGLTAPIFDGGTLRAEKRAAVDGMHASAANYEQAVLAAFGQVADALEALDHDAEQLDAQAHAQQAAGASVDLTQKSYNEGNVGVLQILDAQRLYQQARLGYVKAKAQRYVDTVQLILALGGAGPDAFAGTPDPAPPAGK